MSVQDCRGIDRVVRLGHRQVWRVDNESVGLFAAFAAVAADEFFQCDQSAVVVDGADEREVGGAEEFHDPIQLFIARGTIRRIMYEQ